MVAYTVPGMKSDSAERVIKLLQDRLNSLEQYHWLGRDRGSRPAPFGPKTFDPNEPGPRLRRLSGCEQRK